MSKVRVFKEINLKLGQNKSRDQS